MSRLAAAQRKVAKLVEGKLMKKQSMVLFYEAQVSGISGAMSGSSSSALVHRDAALKKLARVMADKEMAGLEAEELTVKLVAGRSREKILTAQSATIRRDAERKAEEEAMRETALLMTAKACHKETMGK